MAVLRYSLINSGQSMYNEAETHDERTLNVKKLTWLRSNFEYFDDEGSKYPANPKTIKTFVTKIFVIVVLVISNKLSLLETRACLRQSIYS